MDISKYLQTNFYFLLCAFLHFQNSSIKGSGPGGDWRGGMWQPNALGGWDPKQDDLTPLTSQPPLLLHLEPKSTLSWQLLHPPSAPSHLVFWTDAHRPCPSPQTFIWSPRTGQPQPARLPDRPDGQVQGPGAAWGKLSVELDSFFSHIIAAAVGRKGKCQ